MRRCDGLHPRVVSGPAAARDAWRFPVLRPHERRQVVQGQRQGQKQRYEPHHTLIDLRAGRRCSAASRFCSLTPDADVAVLQIMPPKPLQLPAVTFGKYFKEAKTLQCLNLVCHPFT